MVSFGSPVIHKEFIGLHACDTHFTDGLSKFIDDFEEATKEMRNKLGRRLIKDTSAERNWANGKGVSYPKTEYSASEQVDSYKDDILSIGSLSLLTKTKYIYKDYKAKYLGGGVSGDVYSLYMDYFNSPSYVIKEAKKKKHSNPIEMNPGGIKSEFKALKENKNGCIQEGAALLGTQDGNYFLVSRFEKGDAAGIKHISRTQHEFNKVDTKRPIYIRYQCYGQPISEKRDSILHKTMDIVKSLDDENLFNSDLNIGNFLYSGSSPKLIDLQWQIPMDKAYKFFTFAPDEKKTNFAPFEAGFVASYIHDVNEHHTLEGSPQKGRTEARTFLREYLQERAEYCDTSNRFESLKQAVYENPTEDVLDAELLRLSILKNHNHKFLYNDGLVETPRDMLKGLRYMARANLAAKMLEEFKPQKDESQMSEKEKAYFEEMRQLGSFWHDKTKRWYSSSLENMKSKIIYYPQAQYPHGDEQVYWPKAYGQGVNPEDKAINSNVADKTKLSDVLSDGAKAKWDDIMEKDETIIIRGKTATFNSLSSDIIKLEKSFIKLKETVDKKNYSAQSDTREYISGLIKEVLI